MEIIFELIFQFVFEFILQIVFEVLAELGLHSVKEPFKKPPNPWLAAIGYAILGASAGALSLWIFPTLFLVSENAQIAGVVLTPIVAGVAMAAFGAWRHRRNQNIIRLDKFAYGYLFALAMALVRFAFGH